ncbi:MAG: family transcriptional regulator [Caproiciproducens sp.]|nr:family transcriptional regulator [Caproiciproducens sp.]
MKEINIARAIINKRKEKGLTQDDLANYIGVSKASVSKWETGQSYPDITFLPQLAAYFNISIDDLMCYDPQMTKEDIRKLYLELSADFASEPFDEVLCHCRGIVKKYFSCFPLLFQIGVLLVNYSPLSKDADITASIIAEAKEIFIRVKKESDDVKLAKQALGMEAICALSLGNPNEVLELLGETNTPLYCAETVLAPAYQMIGKIEEAKTVLQVGIYQHIVALFGIFPYYLSLCADDMEQFEEIYRRIMDIARTFHIMELHPSILLNVFFFASQGYLANGSKDKALNILEKYTQLVTGDIYPLQLKGDEFFNLLDNWLDEFALGTALPREEKTVKKSMAEAVVNNPTFSTLADERRFQSIVERLKNNC